MTAGEGVPFAFKSLSPSPFDCSEFVRTAIEQMMALFGITRAPGESLDELTARGLDALLQVASPHHSGGTMKYIYVDGEMHTCEGCGALVLRLDEPRHDAFHERVDVVPLGTIDTTGKLTGSGL